MTLSVTLTLIAGDIPDNHPEVTIAEPSLNPTMTHSPDPTRFLHPNPNSDSAPTSNSDSARNPTLPLTHCGYKR